MKPKKVQSYHFIEGYSLKKLNEAINEKVEEGFVTDGDIIIYPITTLTKDKAGLYKAYTEKIITSVNYYQKMVKYEEE